MTKTTNATHTPETLAVDRNHPTQFCDGAGRPIGSVYTEYGRRVEAIDTTAELSRRWNAYPDLLAACKEAVDRLDRHAPAPVLEVADDLLPLLRSALAKATGGAA